MEGVTLTKVVHEYHQDGDDMQVDNAYQSIRITADDAGAGFYFVIETERWAINNPEDILELIGEVKKSLKE